jgi:hypothetical protein
MEEADVGWRVLQSIPSTRFVIAGLPTVVCPGAQRFEPRQLRTEVKTREFSDRNNIGEVSITYPRAWTPTPWSI